MRSFRIALANVVLAACLTQAGCLKVHLNNLDSTTPLGLITTLFLTRSTPGFLAVGANCSAWTSESGTAWTLLSNPFTGCSVSGTGTLYSVAYGNGTYVVVGSTTSATTGCGIWTSTDGATWTARTCALAYPLRSVAFSKSRGHFVAAGANSNSADCDVLVGNSDGSTWTAAATKPTCGGGMGAVFSKSMIAYGNKFMLMSSLINTFTTTDGSAWVPTGFSPGLTPSNTLVAVAAPRVAVVGQMTGVARAAYTDDDGVSTWTTNASTTGAEIKVGAFDGSRFVGVGFNCELARSTDNLASISAGTTTFGSNCSNIDWSALVYSSSRGRYVAGGRGSVDIKERFAYSTTGELDTWTILQLANSNTVNAIAAAD